MRGALGFGWWAGLFCGIIPAYAGSTPCCRWACRSLRDHPRVCGEHNNGGNGGVNMRGSSPRMRGARRRRGREDARERIIPAYAGSTCHPALGQASPRDHPRVCGEHAFCFLMLLDILGSSPRMRGALFIQCNRPVRSRIIPAYAGSTRDITAMHRLVRDHPRVCGEHTSRSASLQ